MNNKLMEKAAMQVLCDWLGYVEGKVYFNLLTKKEMPKDYSRSKTYRILASLVELGAVAKVIKTKKEFFTYIPLPPTFLYFKQDFISTNKTFLENKEIAKYLEEIYLENYPDIFSDTYLEITLTWLSALDVFLAKYYMKDYAIILNGSIASYLLFREVLPKEKLSRVKYFCRKGSTNKSYPEVSFLEQYQIGNKRTLIFDGKILIEYLVFPFGDNQHPGKIKYRGYLISKNLKIKTSSGEFDYIKKTEDELKKFLKINK